VNKYEFYSTILKEDFPVKYRAVIAEHDSEQRKKINDLKVKLGRAVDLLLDASEPTGPVIRYEDIKNLLLEYAQGDSHASSNLSKMSQA